MKLFVLTILFSIFAQGSFASAHENEKFITSIVELYRPEILQRYGQQITLTFIKSDIFQAIGGWDEKGEIVIEVYAKVVSLPKEQVAAVMCHEIGHILGNVPMSRLNPEQRPGHLDPRNNVEGEADYYSGSCLLKLFASQINPEEAALNAVKELYKSMYNRQVELKIDLEPFAGINPKYPSPECRLLSAHNGITEKPRPLCWYNP